MSTKIPTRDKWISTFFLIWYSSCLIKSVAAFDEEWSDWSPWSPCPVTCGKGTKMRHRTCLSGFCQGKFVEHTECGTELSCPVNGGWSSWSTWSECSVSCGEGTKNRQRLCNNPVPQVNGRKCRGRTEETITCRTLKECPRDGDWSSWGQWSECSVTCGGGGSIQRYRSCTNPIPVGGGKQCNGDPHNTKTCESTIKCPVNGQWSEWTEWTECSVTCGQGERSRRRNCDNPPPLYEGKDCDRTDAGEIQIHSCIGTVEDCPVHGGWSAWSDWGQCYTPECELSEALAYSFRERSCNSPLPTHKGLMCQGTFLDYGLCASPINCKVDGGWSEWSEWNCTAFVASRSRTCDNPPPSNGGRDCVDKNVEYHTKGKETYNEACPEFPPDETDIEDESSGLMDPNQEPSGDGGFDDSD